MNQEGLIFQAAIVTDCPKVFPARGPWVTARTSASATGMSGAMFFSTPSLVRRTKPALSVTVVESAGGAGCAPIRLLPVSPMSGPKADT